jgi:hypothetical protein
LVHGGQDVGVFLADVVDFLDLFDREVGEAETAEYTVLMGFVYPGEGVFNGYARVGRVDVEDIELLDPHGFETRGGVGDDFVFGYVAWAEAADEFGVDGKLSAGVELADGDFGTGVETGGVDGFYVEGEECVEDFGTNFGRVELARVSEAGAAEDNFDHDWRCSCCC